MKKKELELYVHIPFCIKKCAYCDFLSASAGEEERASYTDALIREIESAKKEFGTYTVSSVFMGGGTPSVLTGEETARIFRALRDSFSICGHAEITMEVNPGTVTQKKASAWKQCGINRLSIGLQSVNDQELKMLGRIHTYREFIDTWHILRENGFDNMNIDLISAIPGQTEESWEKTLRTVADMGPEHISAYSLIIEEGTPFYEMYSENVPCREEWRLPDEDTERRIYKMTKQILKEYGYHRYEISNYAKSGYECRHNLGYWERREYLGLGLGASSLVRECRFHNTEDMKKYMEVYGGTIRYSDCAKDCTEEYERLSEKDRMAEFMFLGLRKTAGISQSKFEKIFGRKIEDVYGKQISRFVGLGLMRKVNDRIFLTENGIDVSNYVFTDFL